MIKNYITYYGANFGKFKEQLVDRKTIYAVAIFYENKKLSNDDVYGFNTQEEVQSFLKEIKWIN